MAAAAIAFFVEPATLAADKARTRTYLPVQDQLRFSASKKETHGAPKQGRR